MAGSAVLKRVAAIATCVACARSAVAQPVSDAPPPVSDAPPPPPPPPPPPAPATPAAAPIAAPEPAAPPEPVEQHLGLHDVQIHGFLGEGGFVSTDNNYIGHSSRGSLEFLNAGVNVSTDVTDKLHAGIQLFSQDVGTANDPTPRLDWAFVDYHWKPKLGFRGGRVRIPFGLYNEYVDIDSSRTQLLLPQSVYPITDRTTVTAQTGFEAYGELPIPSLGSVDYQIYSGVLSVPNPGAQDANGSRVYAFDSKYVYGGTVFWHPPIDGLRAGYSLLRASFDEYLNLSPALTNLFVMSGVVPPTFDGNVVVSARPASLWVLSAEYLHGDWQLAAEYSRWYARAPVTPAVLPTTTSLSERYYGLATYRISDRFDVGVYYSVLYADIHDRDGTDMTKFAKPYDAWSRDAVATLRYDINDHWLVKVESHFIDGAAYLDATLNPMPTRYWGMFLFNSTVTF